MKSGDSDAVQTWMERAVVCALDGSGGESPQPQHKASVIIEIIPVIY